MAKRRHVYHLVYTNAAGKGGPGHRVVTWPQEWNQQQVKEVARWLATLRMLPEVKVSAGYAARRFGIAQSTLFCLARLQPNFSLDQGSREGSTLLHAMFLEADPSDQGGMHLVALAKSAREVFDLGSVQSLPAEQRLQVYLQKCEGIVEVEVPTATIETFNELGLDTIKQLFLALSAADPSRLASFTEPSDFTLPQRLAYATGALPPRLRLNIGWGTWIHPAEGLNFVARIGGELSPRVELKGHFQDYFVWLQTTLENKRRGELKRVLEDWTINDWEQLSAVGKAKETRGGHVAGRPTTPDDFAPPPRGQLELSSEDPSLLGAEQPGSWETPSVADSSQPSSAPTSSTSFVFQVTPEFLNQQIAQITETLNQTFENKLSQIEERLREDIRKELGTFRGTSVLTADHGAPRDVSMVELDGAENVGETQEGSRKLIWKNWWFVVAGLALLLIYLVVVRSPRPSSDVDGSTDRRPSEEQASPGQGPATEREDTTDWVEAWGEFVKSDARRLAAICTRIADAEGLNVSDEQRRQFRLIAGTLATNGNLSRTEIDILRYGVFEYSMTFYELESGRSKQILIDLVLDDVPLELAEKAIIEFDISLQSLGIPILNRAVLGDPNFQAAIALSWIRGENRGVSNSP